MAATFVRPRLKVGFRFPARSLSQSTGNENDSDGLPACQRLRVSFVPSGEVLVPQPLSVSQAPVLEEERGRRCKKAHLIIIGLWMRKKVVSLSRFRRTPIRIKRPHFLIMGYLNLRLPPRKGRLFLTKNRKIAIQIGINFGLFFRENPQQNLRLFAPDFQNMRANCVQIFGFCMKKGVT